MGLDLDFIAQGKQRPFNRNYEIFCQMSSAFDDVGEQVLFSRPLPEDHHMFDFRDGYGKVSCLTAGEISEKLIIPKDASDQNHGIKRWIDSMPPDEIVILYWH